MLPSVHTKWFSERMIISEATSNSHSPKALPHPTFIR